MKYLLIYTLFIVSAFHTSCGQNQTNLPKDNSKNDLGMPTRYEYRDAASKRLIIQNSFPKGGLPYKDQQGKEYRRVVFWTRITNETDNPLEFQLDFSGDAYECPGSVGSSVNSHYKIILHPDTMTPDKEGLQNYGLTGVDSFINSTIHKPSSLKRTVNPGTSTGFYVVRLLIKPDSGWRTEKADGNGTTRAGLSLQGQALIYTLNGKAIPCGQVNLKNFSNPAQDNSRVGYTETQMIAADTSPVPMGMVRNVKQARNGDILVAAYLGMFRYHGTSFTNLTSKIIPGRFATFWDVLEDRQGTLWLASQDSGVYRYDGKSFQLFTTRDGLASNSALSIYEDSAGNIWFGSTRYDGKSFRNFTTKDGFPSNSIRLLLEDKTGKLWFGAQGENLFVYDGNSYTVLKDAAGKTFNNVWSVMEDKKGNIWFGDNRGLWRYDGTTFTKLSQRHAYAIIQDKKGNIWTTGEATSKDWALSRYEANSLYDKKPAFTEIISAPPAFLGLVEANDGSFLFGSMTGVYRYDGKTVTDFKTAAGL